MKKLKLILIFHAFIACCSLAGQPHPPKKTGGTNTAQMLSGVERDTCLNKKFSVVFYVIQDSAESKTAAAFNSKEIDTIVNILNRSFRRMCVSFRNCSTVIIPNYEYNKWNKSAALDVPNAWYTENTINIYLAEEVLDLPSGESAGYAHAPGVQGAMQLPKEVIVYQYVTIPPDNKRHALENNAVPFRGSTIVHIMGHYFGLPDTHSEIVGPDPGGTNEMVRRVNCNTTGDGFCDTEADPYPKSYFPPISPPGTYCYYWPVEKDSEGNYYTPPVDNFMSAYECRCRFTQQQVNHMVRYILQKRMHLH